MSTKQNGKVLVNDCHITILHLHLILSLKLAVHFALCFQNNGVECEKCWFRFKQTTKAQTSLHIMAFLTALLLFTHWKKKIKWAAKCNFQHWGILTSVDLDKPVQPPFKLRNYKWCLISSLIFIDNQSDQQRVWSDCPYAQAGLSICWLHRPHCCKSHVVAQINLLQAMSLFSYIQAHTQVIISYEIYWHFDKCRLGRASAASF